MGSYQTVFTHKNGLPEKSFNFYLDIPDDVWPYVVEGRRDDEIEIISARGGRNFFTVCLKKLSQKFLEELFSR